MTKITSQDVLKVAKLSRLEISDSEVELFTSQLEKILGYVAQLEKVDTTNIEPTTRAVEVINVMREDTVIAANVRDDLLDQAPQREGDFYRVPKILSD
jgi:aspartyl-tRNA(Asn)/glutamyl-tRNA(Gln) amidotransferase subunit C